MEQFRTGRNLDPPNSGPDKAGTYSGAILTFDLFLFFFAENLIEDFFYYFQGIFDFITKMGGHKNMTTGKYGQFLFNIVVILCPLTWEWIHSDLGWINFTNFFEMKSMTVFDWTAYFTSEEIVKLIHWKPELIHFLTIPLVIRRHHISLNFLALGGADF